MPTLNMALLDILNYLFDNTHSDLHITSDKPPYVRNKSGNIEKLTNFPPLTEQEILDAIVAMAGGNALVQFNTTKELDFAYDFRRQKLRVNAYRNMDGLSLAFRVVPTRIASLEDIQLGASEIKSLLHRKKGLILVSGPTGSGKSTTLAAMLQYINETQTRHIITIEDPVEFAFQNDKALIHQREVGRHTKDFGSAIRSVLREDPDVIMIGEMRDLETIQAALTLAETGHMVVSTLHTNDTVQSISRIVNSFPPEQQGRVRMQLGMSLTAVFSQVLIPRKDGAGKMVAREIMINNDAIRSVIMDNSPLHRLYSVIETARKEGMILMDQYLVSMIEKGYVDLDSAILHIRDKDLVQSLRQQQLQRTPGGRLV